MQSNISDRISVIFCHSESVKFKKHACAVMCYLRLFTIYVNGRLQYASQITQQVTSKVQNVLFLPQKGLTYMYNLGRGRPIVLKVQY